MKLKKQADKLIDNIPHLVKKFKNHEYKKGPSFYFYKRVLDEVLKKNSIGYLLEDKNFIELIYSTLVSWNMDSRGAKMKYFDDFFVNIRKNHDYFVYLSNFKLERISEEKIKEVSSKLEILFSKLEVMNSKGRLVSNSKIMHFILPHLVMPMDRKNTLMFFYNNTGESKNKFLEIFESSWYIAKRMNLSYYLDDDWNRTIPKIIDNAIIAKKI